MKKDKRFWVWGYTLEHVPGPAYFVSGSTSCSLKLLHTIWIAPTSAG